VAELLKEMKVLREEIGDGDGKIKRFLDRWIERLSKTKIEIVMDKINPTHDWSKPGRKGIWVLLGNGFNEEVLLEFHRSEIVVIDRTRDNIDTLRPPERCRYTVFDGSKIKF